MLARSIAFVIAICAIVAFFIPSASDEPTHELSPQNDVMHVKIDPTARQPETNWYSGDHILDRASDGHFYAEAYVSGTPVRMMVDTGASVIALTGSDANAVGLYWDNSEVRHIGSGASGAVYGVPARLDRVDIGGMTRQNVDAVIIPEGLEISLLGQSYLSQVGSVQISGNQLVMSGN